MERTDHPRVRAIARLTARAGRDFAAVAPAAGRPIAGSGVSPEYRAKALLGPRALAFPAGRLRSPRGAPALHIDAIAGIVAATGRLLLDSPAMCEIDLNPVVVYSVGEDAVALDALIIAD